MHQVDNNIPAKPMWSAIFAIAVSVGSLITAELLPASLLTPMAQELGITQGMAGQSLTVTALAAIFASLFAASLTRRIDRRLVVMGYSVLLIVSSLLAAFGPGFGLMLFGRVLLGLALGGFWSMAASLTMRLAPPADVPKALSMVFGGVSVALVIAAPAGSYLGAILGWRGVFVVSAVLGVICLAWQARTLPRMPAQGSGGAGAVFAVFKRPGVPLAMLAIFAVFAGQFAFFSYMRPFFENVSGFGVQGVSLLLLLFGVANCIGTSLSPVFLKTSLKLTLALGPLVLACCAAGMLLAGPSPAATVLLVAAWGFVFGTVPVGWSTWVTRELGDDAENAGGLQVAVIQLANTAGAAIGGLVLDSAGARAPIMVAGLLLGATFLIVATCVSAAPGVAAGGQRH